MQSIPAEDGDLEVPIPSREEYLHNLEKVALRGDGNAAVQDSVDPEAVGTVETGPCEYGRLDINTTKPTAEK